MSGKVGPPIELDSPRSLLEAGGIITCKYTCGLCGVTEQDVAVPARLGEDVLQWLRNVMTPQLVIDHRRRSTDCYPTEFETVMVPIPVGTEKIGGPVVQ